MLINQSLGLKHNLKIEGTHSPPCRAPSRRPAVVGRRRPPYMDGAPDPEKRGRGGEGERDREGKSEIERK